METPIDLVLSKLHNVKEHDNYYTAQCPAHQDKRNSLSISQGEDGKVLLKCHANCDMPAIVKELGLTVKDLFPPKQKQSTSKGRIVATYDYTDEHNKRLFQTVRYEPKNFVQRRPDGKRGWIYDLKNTRRVLYRLPDLVQANAHEPVFIVEGEKDADNLKRIGLLATTNPMGAGKWRNEYSPLLQGRHVVILPDNDKAGCDHAKVVAQSVYRHATSVKIVELPNLLPKGDVSDWISAGGNKDTLLSLIVTAPVYTNGTGATAPQATMSAGPDGAAPTPTRSLPNEQPIGGRFLEPDEILAAFQRAEIGDAEMLARLYADRITFDHTERAWFLWSGHIWQLDRKGAVSKFITDDVASQYLHAAAHVRQTQPDSDRKEKEIRELYQRTRNLRNRSRLSNVLALAETRETLALTGDEWNADPMLLGVANGVIDLRTGELRQGNPHDYIRTASPIAWDGLDCPAIRWERFMYEIFNGDKELIAFFQRLLGYGVTGLTTEHKLPVLYGAGRNGKGTALEIFKHVLGELASPVSKDVLLDTGGRHGGAATPHLYDLRGRRIVWVSETNEGERLNAGQVKQLTGGDTIPTRPLYGKPITFAPSHLLLLVTNSKPHVNAEDYAIWQRILLIPFTQAFVDDPQEAHEQKADPNLRETLKAEASGILAWLVQGCLEWQRSGLKPPESVKAATADYRNEEDDLRKFFEACCIGEPTAETKASELYTTYKAWAVECGFNPMNANRFGERMKKRYPQKHSSSPPTLN